MKSQMTSFDIAAIVGELQRCVGLRAEKFFLLGHRDMFFRLTGEGMKKSITINLNHGLWIEDGFRTTADSEPPTFAMLLRKYLSGAELAGVWQHGFDRIVAFEFGREVPVQLVAELFGSGNIILVREGRIIQPLTSKSWKARDVKAGRPYSFPPESADPLSLDLDALAKMLRKSTKDLVRCLATEVNLGGVYAEDACLQLGLDKSMMAGSLSDTEVEGLMSVIAGYRSKLENPSPGIVIGQDGVQADLLPFPLSIYGGSEMKPFENLSLAANEYFANLPEKALTALKSPRQEQLERQLEMQTEALKGLEAQAEEYQRLGDAVYADYARLDAKLSKLHNILVSGNWQSVGREVMAIEGVTKFDPAGGTVTVKLPDDMEAKLDVRLDLNGNAAAMYELGKRARQKAEGAASAILETEKLLAQNRKAGSGAQVITDRKPTKKFWFDRYRWFMSSEGFLVVGGRDTRSNDQVVKKHLQDGDLYAHADVNGAPSVVIKDGRKAGEATIEEACVFAVSFSRAWKSKLASGNAYWVKPDQVSKTPEPGEFVPKGAFIIRGKRNYSRKLEIRLAVGLVKIEGHDKVMCGPVAAVRTLTAEHYVLTPGGRKRSDFAKILSEKYRIPIEEVDRVLPPGDLVVNEIT